MSRNPSEDNQIAEVMRGNISPLDTILKLLEKSSVSRYYSSLRQVTHTTLKGKKMRAYGEALGLYTTGQSQMSSSC